MEKDKRKSFLLYTDSLKVLDNLTDEEAGKIFKAIRSYQETGEYYLEGLLSAVFTPFKTIFENNNEKYMAVVERNRTNGAKGGRPKNPKNPVGFLETQTNPKNLDNDNVNVNVNENVNEKEISSSSSLSPSSSLLGFDDFSENQQEGYLVDDFSEEEPENDVVNGDFSETKEDVKDYFSLKGKKSEEKDEDILLPHAVTEEERRFLENHILINRPDVNNIKAYVDRLIANGDYKRILADKPMSAKEKEKMFIKLKKEYAEKKRREEAERKEAERLEAEERVLLEKKREEEKKKKIQSQIPLMKDKTSAAAILFEYIDNGVPDEFREFAEKYELDTPEKVRKVYFEDLRKRHNLPRAGFT